MVAVSCSNFWFWNDEWMWMFHAKIYHHDHFDPVTLCNILRSSKIVMAEAATIPEGLSPSKSLVTKLSDSDWRNSDVHAYILQYIVQTDKDPSGPHKDTDTFTVQQRLQKTIQWKGALGSMKVQVLIGQTFNCHLTTLGILFSCKHLAHARVKLLLHAQSIGI